MGCCMQPFLFHHSFCFTDSVLFSIVSESSLDDQKFSEAYDPMSLDIYHIAELRICKRVSGLPIKFRTAIWTILNNILWNAHIWVPRLSRRIRVISMRRRIPKVSGGEWTPTLDPITGCMSGWAMIQTILIQTCYRSLLSKPVEIIRYFQ